MNWKFDHIYFNGEWVEDLIVQTTVEGKIHSTYCGTEDDGSDLAIDQHVAGYAIPGLVNAHSHAFQYAMAGLSENLPTSASTDDFWSWRNRMYQLALSLSPEHMEQIAIHLYSQMLAQGYTWVVEFHYLHHASDGSHYSNIGEMGTRLIRAAEKTGIGITLVPIFYQQGGFGKAAGEEQRRFICKDFDTYLNLQQSFSKQTDSPRFVLGAGIHSLRAVNADSISSFSSHFSQNKTPIHIHIAEQTAEIDDCIKFYGKRPVEWLSEACELNEDWNLVHATHINDDEIKHIAESRANVVICPTTEANLGDGIFPFNKFWANSGRICIGSDSHIRVDAFEELRWLDYVQRLQQRKRNIVCKAPGEDSGQSLFDHCLLNGAKSAGINAGLCIGNNLDVVVIDHQRPLWENLHSSRRLSQAIYCKSQQDLLGTISAGRWVVKNGQVQSSAAKSLSNKSLSEIRRSIS